MRRLVLLSVFACGSYPLQPVKPRIFEDKCHVPLFVGYKVERRISWECDLGQEGRRGTNKDGRCIGALTTTAWCPDDRCTTTVEAVPQYQGFYGENRVAIVPTVPGPLEVFAELRHEVGLVERHRLIACEALPAPELVIGCKVRDPATGAYVDCPAELPSGAEVHLEATASVASGTTALPTLDVYLDGKGLHMSTFSNGKGISCARAGDEDDPRRRAVRCVLTSLAPGEHTFEMEMRPLPKQSRTFVVR